jgi:hypothetical protein
MALAALFMQSKWLLTVESDDVQEELRKRGKKPKYCCGLSSARHIPYLIICRDILGTSPSYPPSPLTSFSFLLPFLTSYYSFNTILHGILFLI